MGVGVNFCTGTLVHFSDIGANLNFSLNRHIRNATGNSDNQAYDNKIYYLGENTKYETSCKQGNVKNIIERAVYKSSSRMLRCTKNY
jgi:hypothetical protein